MQKISGIKLLSYIGIGSLMLSAACVILIFLICCYNIFFKNVGADWGFSFKFLKRMKKKDYNDTNQSSDLLTRTKQKQLKSYEDHLLRPISTNNT